MSTLEWVKTSDRLPPINNAVELLGYGAKISAHYHGMYSIMRFDGTWWNEDGTEHSIAPEYWATIPEPE
jgi:hypothetical protein